MQDNWIVSVVNAVRTTTTLAKYWPNIIVYVRHIRRPTRNHFRWVCVCVCPYEGELMFISLYRAISFDKLIIFCPNCLFNTIKIVCSTLSCRVSVLFFFSQISNMNRNLALCHTHTQFTQNHTRHYRGERRFLANASTENENERRRQTLMTADDDCWWWLMIFVSTNRTRCEYIYLYHFILCSLAKSTAELTEEKRATRRCHNSHTTQHNTICACKP